ncbi:MAG: hypothetical protein MZV63_36325 [Marinilabiliales bacterium]|nr:hypothetical protein [Marinilabiliales bacterium]
MVLWSEEFFKGEQLPGAWSFKHIVFLDLSLFEGKNNPVIMIVSGWQDVNIGDIAHTPGLHASF